MQLSDFNFDLPQDLIALEPLAQRDQSRLLHVKSNGKIADKTFKDCLSLFEQGDVLVLNNSRVVPAALRGIRRRGEVTAKVHFNLHKRHSAHEWYAFAKPLKRLAVGDKIYFGSEEQTCFMTTLEATVSEVRKEGDIKLSFDKTGVVLDEQLHIVGEMPLPPYIAGKRPPNEKDKTTYQTVYAKDEGSVAAPTAGLHFTNELLAALRAKGVDIHFVTLHVGAGTFLPVKVEAINEHKMHAEWGEVSAACVAAIHKAKAEARKVTAVGTTSLRLLESAARSKDGLTPWQGDTDIFIQPGFNFNVVDRLITNFHLPKSTLFMLVAAFSGLKTMQDAYQHAITQSYRFYSYGDACFLERAE